MFFGHGEAGRSSSHGQDWILVDREHLLPPLDVVGVCVEVQRSVHLAGDEVDSKAVPEGTKRTAVLGVARVLLGSWPARVTQTRPLTLRPHSPGLGFHEGLHGHHGLVLGQAGYVEDRVPGYQLDLVTAAGVRYPGRQHEGPTGQHQQRISSRDEARLTSPGPH